jgi:hypothetical protein
VKEITTAILYIPREDSLIEFVSLLDEFRISFGAHAHGDEILRIMGKNRSGMRGNKG